MILQKKTINNVPTLVPLTADTGSGVPVGTIIGQYKKVNMAGYLYLDGSTFDQTLYPALYAYLGTNVLPDYREFVLVGAEQNTTSATIADHDVFTQGQEKDDQLQEHEHYIESDNLGTPNDKFYNSSAGTGNIHASFQYIGAQEVAPYLKAREFVQGRHGTTTRTKEKAVFWYIKATTGIIESEATEMLNVFNNRMFPDYAHPLPNPTSSSWTATEDCYVVMEQLISALVPDSDLPTIDGEVVGRRDTTTISGTSVTSVMFSGYVKKGSVVRWTYLYSSSMTKFFPLGS